MLFNSFEFIVAFLPICLILYYVFTRIGSAPHAISRIAIVWLIVCSLFFYAWWQPAFIAVLLASILVNYFIGQRILATRAQPEPDSQADSQAHSQPNHQHQPSSINGEYRTNRAWLTVGIVFNLGLLGWFKYAAFVANSLAYLSGSSLTLPAIALPLAISFFTFQQIAWLVDCRRGRVHSSGFMDYVLFVSFFPQLISGPIVHHSEMMPQFRQNSSTSLHLHLAVGLTLFTFGLFKKTVIADGIGQYASLVFNAPAGDLSFGDAWGGALAYSMQLYFDFSGYSDMAVGLAYMFGIRLPLNFYSPYQAPNIVEFWRRWHMTLSRFLRDYLYIPLGGNRRGPARRYLNLMLTMVLGGLWHGAGWQFILWGAMHGFFLVVCQTWQRLLSRVTRGTTQRDSRWSRLPGVALTFVVVVVAWVPFRADGIDSAMLMYQAMFLSSDGATLGPFASSRGTIILIIVCACALLAPNTSQILGKYDPAIKSPETGLTRSERQGFVVQWSPGIGWCAVVAVLLISALYRMMTTGYVEFLYRFF